jgi:hypothetical protein
MDASCTVLQISWDNGNASTVEKQNHDSFSQATEPSVCLQTHLSEEAGRDHTLFYWQQVCDDEVGKKDLWSP